MMKFDTNSTVWRLIATETSELPDIIKNYMSLTYDKSLIALNAEWNTIDPRGRTLIFAYRSTCCWAFCEDYKRVVYKRVVNAR